MSKTTANIVIGEGDITIDGIDLGFTVDGFTLRQEQEWFDALVDQSVGVQKKKLVRRRLFGQANVGEGSLANRTVSYGLQSNALSGQTLTFSGTDRGVVTATFTQTAANPSGFDRVLTFSRVVNLGNSETPFVRDGISFVPVEFEILPSVDASDVFFTVVDLTA